VKAGNDANVAALGEFWKGGGQDYDNVVFVTLGTGVGGGIVVEGNLLHGAHGSGAEIGHICVNTEETVRCNCGNYGCVEQYCSATGIVRLAKRHLNRTKAPSALRELEKLECKDVFGAAAQGDAVAREILEDVYDRLAQFLADVCNVVDPELVLIGGGVSKAGQPLLDGVSRYIGKYLFHAIAPLKFALATLGNDAGAYGAFKLILDESK
jgi:glucokinase